MGIKKVLFLSGLVGVLALLVPMSQPAQAIIYTNQCKDTDTCAGCVGRGPTDTCETVLTTDYPFTCCAIPGCKAYAGRERTYDCKCTDGVTGNVITNSNYCKKRFILEPGGTCPDCEP